MKEFRRIDLEVPKEQTSDLESVLTRGGFYFSFTNGEFITKFYNIRRSNSQFITVQDIFEIGKLVELNVNHYKKVDSGDVKDRDISLQYDNLDDK